MNGVYDGLTDGVNDGLIDGASDGVKEELIKIAQVFSAHGCSATDIAKAIKRAKPTTAERYIKILCTLGFIEYKGSANHEVTS